MLFLLFSLTISSTQTSVPPQIEPTREVVAPGLKANGPAVVVSPARRGQILAQLPVTYRSWGRLVEAIEQPRQRMAVGTLVYRARFTSSASMAGDVYDAWCGQGQIKRFFNFSDGLVCIVDTADGRATVTEAATRGAWWSPSMLGSMYEDIRVDRPNPTPASADAVSLIREVKLSIIRDDDALIGMTTTGPDGDDSRTVGEPLVGVSIRNNVARIPIAGHLLQVTLSEDRSSAETEARLIDPSLIEAAIVAAQTRAKDARDLTPFVVGAAKVNVAEMTVAQGIVERRGILASTSGTRARSGQIEREVRTDRGGTRIAAGSNWHYIEQPSTQTAGTPTQRGYWCGPGRIVSIIGSVDTTFCAGQQASGLWRVYPAYGEPWLVGTYVVTQPIEMYTEDLPIIDTQDDPLPPFDFEIVLRDVNERRVRLHARASHDEKVVPVWYGDFEWANDQVIVPMWSHQLVLRRSGNGVTVEMQKSADETAGLNTVGDLPSPSTTGLW